MFVVTVVAAVAIQYAMQELLEYIWTQGNTAIQIPIEQEIPDTVADDNISYSKKSKDNKKKRATNKPSWVNKNMIDWSKNAQTNAKNMLDNKYGKGNWHPGAGQEFNKIVKWLVRDVGLHSMFSNLDYYGDMEFSDYGAIINGKYYWTYNNPECGKWPLSWDDYIRQ